VRFLVDRCAGRKLAEWLRLAGHDVLDAREIAPDPGDAALLAMAAGQRRIVITIDTDFGTLVHLGGAAHAGLIRMPDVPARRRIALMEQLLSRYPEAELTGSIVTIRGNRIRLSRPAQ